jgi:succinoglycan biosynthesis protein ExoL
MKLAYFAHNLNDPAVDRRLRMLSIGGCTDIVVLGFRRGDAPVTEISGFQAIDLGQTRDGDFRQRILSVARAARGLRSCSDSLRDRDVFMGRNIEALLLAHLARRRFARGAGLVYECLDIHRLFLAGRAAPVMRKIEKYLLKRTDLVVVSSPDYDNHYFARVHGTHPPRLLVENKALEGEIAQPTGRGARSPGPPWRIGWFGALRCRESLHFLAELTEALGGLVEVDVRGTPSRQVMPEFDDVMAGASHMRFHGRYDRSRDLEEIYSQVHFAWSIDRFEQGMNSDLALSNRLYEAVACGAVVIAEAKVAMGRWLAARGTGVLTEDPVLPHLMAFFRELDAATYKALADAAASVSASAFIATEAECRAVVEALAATRKDTAETEPMGVPENTGQS